MRQNLSQDAVAARWRSFDVFDTVLVRTWADPKDLFWELAVRLRRHGLIGIGPELWQRKRVDAEDAARQSVGRGEVTLREIYWELAPLCGWNHRQSDDALEQEIELEAESVRAVPRIAREIRILRGQGVRIAFLSDMYLPSEVIRRFLVEQQVWGEGDLLFVSGDFGITKMSGQLFRYFQEQTKAAFGDIQHTGDNADADVKVPASLGIAVAAFRDCHLNRYERLIAGDERLPLRWRSLLAGASRMTRLQCEEKDGHRRTIWNTAANVVGPILFGYVHWILMEAQRRGIRRLYFVARDGQILLRIAQVLCRQWGCAVECRYLYGSRQAFMVPAIVEVSEGSLGWLFSKPDFISVRSMCQRVNLTPDSFADVFCDNGFPRELWDKNLTANEYAALKRLFLSPAIRWGILRRAAFERANAIGYFRQEGMGDGTPFALVDVGWSGGAQRAFSQLLDSAGLYPEAGVREFYFAVDDMVQPFRDDVLIPYFLEATETSGRYLLCHREILELFLGADHGGTVGYERVGEGYRARLRAPKNEAGINWGVLVQQEAVVKYSEVAAGLLDSAQYRVADHHRATEALLERFVWAPTREEAAVFGAQSFSQHPVEGCLYELAPAYGFAAGVRLWCRFESVHRFVWLAGSLRRSHWLSALYLRGLRLVRESKVHVFLGMRSYRNGQSRASWLAVRRALRVFPVICLSRTFLRLVGLLAGQGVNAGRG